MDSALANLLLVCWEVVSHGNINSFLQSAHLSRRTGCVYYVAPYFVDVTTKRML